MKLTDLRDLNGSVDYLGRGERSQLEFFSVRESAEGSIFRSDGTPGGTFEVISSALILPLQSQVIGDLLLFSVQGGPTVGEPVEIWATDGTLPGTQKLFEEEGAALNGPFPLDVNRPRPSASTIDGRAIFTRNGFSFQEAWVTDGSAAGTRPLLPVFSAGELGSHRRCRSQGLRAAAPTTRFLGTVERQR